MSQLQELDESSPPDAIAPEAPETTFSWPPRVVAPSIPTMPAATPGSSAAAKPSLKSKSRRELEPIPIDFGALSNAEFYRIWQRIEAMPYFFDDSRRDPLTFGELMARSARHVFWLGGPEVGMLYAYDLVPGLSAGCAIAIWDRVGFRQDDAVRTAMKAVARRFNLHYFWSLVAAPNTLSHRFSAKLGLKKSGDIPEGLCYRGIWTDVVLYTVLARDIP